MAGPDVSGRRVAVVAAPEAAALHGLDGSFVWGDARTFRPGDDAVREWAPGTVIALEGPPPPGPWAAIGWDLRGDRSAGAHGTWRRVVLPAADALAELRAVPGLDVVVAGGDEAGRTSALDKLAARGVPGVGAERLTRDVLARAAVVALLGEQDAPMPDAATAVLAAGRVLVAPYCAPAFGLLAWSDHLPYANEDEMVCAADMAFTFPDAFEAISAMGTVAVEAHLASAVYGRLAIDAGLAASVDPGLELFGDAWSGAVEHAPADRHRGDD
jgi:hypothetical protein